MNVRTTTPSTGTQVRSRRAPRVVAAAAAATLAVTMLGTAPATASEVSTSDPAATPADQTSAAATAAGQYSMECVAHSGIDGTFAVSEFDQCTPGGTVFVYYNAFPNLPDHPRERVGSFDHTGAARSNAGSFNYAEFEKWCTSNLVCGVTVGAASSYFFGKLKVFWNAVR